MNDHYSAPGLADEEAAWRAGAYDVVEDPPDREDDVPSDSPDDWPW